MLFQLCQVFLSFRNKTLQVFELFPESDHEIALKKPRNFSQFLKNYLICLLFSLVRQLSVDKSFDFADNVLHLRVFQLFRRKIDIFTRNFLKNLDFLHARSQKTVIFSYMRQNIAQLQSILSKSLLFARKNVKNCRKNAKTLSNSYFVGLSFEKSCLFSAFVLKNAKITRKTAKTLTFLQFSSYLADNSQESANFACFLVSKRCFLENRKKT